MKNIFSTKSEKIGTAVIGITAAVLAILIALNLLVGALPKNISLLDLSANSMYSINDTSKRDVSKVEEKINIYLLVAGDESSLNDSGVHLNTLLKRITALNSKITYTLVDLYTDTSFLTDRGIDSSTVTLNSIVVESQKRLRYIDSSDIFYYYIEGVGKVSQSEAQLYQMYYNLTPVYRFEGESLIVNSLKYVTSDSIPKIIALTGHGETALADSFKKNLTAIGIEISELAELTLVPSCDMIVINAPTTDLTSAEASLITKYLSGGGKLWVITGPGTSGFVNLMTVISDYGLAIDDNIVIEQSTDKYLQYPFFVIPTVSRDNEAFEGLTSSALMAYSHGIDIISGSGANATPIFVTGESAYAIPADSTSIDKPDGAEEKAFNIAAISEKSNDSAVIWFGSHLFLDESANNQIGGGNFEYATALIKHVCSADESIAANSAEPMVLATEFLTPSASALSVIAILLIIVIPISTVVLGGIYCHKRKRR